MGLCKRGACIFVLAIFMTFVSGTAAAFAAAIGAHKEVKTSKESSKVFNIEAIVRTVENFKSHADVVAFMNMAAENHISIVTVAAKQDEDEDCPSGYVFYNSSIAPKAKGYESFDALADVIAEAHSRGIKVKAWIPQFHDRVAFDKGKAWQMKAMVRGQAISYKGSQGKEYFVSPLNTDVQAYERSIIREIVKNYNVDGVVLDWVRFDDYNNMDDGARVKKEYEAAYGYAPSTINFAADNKKRKQWQEWRTTKLANYIHDVRNDINSIKPGLQFGVFLLPQEFVDVGQDAAKFASYTDFLSPMAYFDDWDKNPEWVSDNCIADTKNKAGSKKIIPALDSDWTDEQYRFVYSDIRKKYPEIDTLAFFVYDDWNKSFMKKLDYMRTNY